MLLLSATAVVVCCVFCYPVPLRSCCFTPAVPLALLLVLLLHLSCGYRESPPTFGARFPACSWSLYFYFRCTHRPSRLP